MSKRHLLFIESDDGVYAYYRALFDKLDFKVTYLTSWEEAYAYVSGGADVAAVVCNVLKPVDSGMDGAEFFLRIRGEKGLQITIISYMIANTGLLTHVGDDDIEPMSTTKKLDLTQMEEKLREID